mmetsp:Transcript_15502/g.18023  ORF Transcript_15502/g.18023 Transcript_15502/m.18023 type:complete len:115 (+) Transcript_15502:1083-1427(+)
MSCSTKFKVIAIRAATIVSPAPGRNVVTRVITTRNVNTDRLEHVANNTLKCVNLASSFVNSGTYASTMQYSISRNTEMNKSKTNIKTQFSCETKLAENVHILNKVDAILPAFRL